MIDLYFPRTEILSLGLTLLPVLASVVYKLTDKYNYRTVTLQKLSYETECPSLR